MGAFRIHKRSRVQQCVICKTLFDCHRKDARVCCPACGAKKGRLIPFRKDMGMFYNQSTVAGLHGEKLVKTVNGITDGRLGYASIPKESGTDTFLRNKGMRRISKFKGTR